MIVPLISLSTFLTVSSVVEAIGIPGLVLGPLGKFKEGHDRMATRSIDKESGLPYQRSKRVRALLGFNPKKYLVLLVIAWFLDIGVCVTYTIIAALPPLPIGPPYTEAPAIMTWVGLLPVCIVIYCAGRLYIHIIQLWT